ncbi:YbhB/YbcL family Raf kinase inhibitor-like protein [Candidatus Dojkabacteria bacterium]|nr:YbhB/YbcL family Raf kinase inhibitor-like protein [Candidatus Dojkabacteria bacterium]
MQIKSPEFNHNENIPSKYTCEGENISPPLTFSEVPENAQTLALIVDDPDAPDPDAPKMTWVHWVVFNIDPKTTEVGENTIPNGGTQGTNNFDELDYGGPCPPIGEHRYFFKLYALDTKLGLDTNATKDDLIEAMDGHVLDEAELIGLYEKQTK